MRILIVSSFFPYPVYSGGQVRLFNLLRQLSKRHKITLVCPIRSEREREYLPKIERFCGKVILTYRGPQWSLRNIVLTAFSSQSFLFTGHKSEEMKRKIKEELEKEKYDLVQVETSYMMPNLPAISRPVVLSAYNIEYLVYKRFTDNFRFFPAKPLLYFDIWKMKIQEKRLWRKADFLVTVSEKDKEEIVSGEIEKKKVFVVPNGVDTKRFKVQPQSRTSSLRDSSSKFKVREEKIILFVGDFRWFPNRDAVKWLLKEIWPKIQLKVPAPEQVRCGAGASQKPASLASLRSGPAGRSKVNLIIAGRGNEYLKRQVRRENVKVLGEVEDIREIYKTADVLLAPMRIGGGTKFKILEAMASGVPVVTTRIGIEGIKGRDGKEVLIRDNIEELVEATIGLLKDSNLKKKLVNNARKLIEERYSWEKIVRKLEEIYKLIKISTDRVKS